MIYPVESAIQLLNNRNLERGEREEQPAWELISGVILVSLSILYHIKISDVAKRGSNAQEELNYSSNVLPSAARKFNKRKKSKTMYGRSRVNVKSNLRST